MYAVQAMSSMTERNKLYPWELIHGKLAAIATIHECYYTGTSTCIFTGGDSGPRLSWPAMTSSTWTRAMSCRDPSVVFATYVPDSGPVFL